MPFKTMISFGLSILAAVLLVANVHAFTDPSEVPATRSELAAHSPLIAVARAGDRIIAGGIRGHIVYSDDGGKNWTQANVPVSTDLVGLSFPTAERGWVVGHNGIVLHTADGGLTWTKQLDGEKAAAIAEAYYSAPGSPAEYASVLEDLKQLQSFEASRAFLDVYFESDTTGFVVGTFNRIFRTTDGGKTWMPWMHRTDNPRELHFYSIRGDGRAIWMTGEQGMVWKLDPAAERFKESQVEYDGTLFGSVSVGSDVYVYGMRGSVFRSSDGGDSWLRLNVPSRAGITGGLDLDDRRLLLVTQGGIALYTADRGETFEVTRLSAPMSYFAVARAGDGHVAVTGPDGVRVEPVSVSRGSALAGRQVE